MSVIFIGAMMTKTTTTYLRSAHGGRCSDAPPGGRGTARGQRCWPRQGGTWHRPRPCCRAGGTWNRPRPTLLAASTFRMQRTSVPVPTPSGHRATLVGTRFPDQSDCPDGSRAPRPGFASSRAPGRDIGLRGPRFARSPFTTSGKCGVRLNATRGEGAWGRPLHPEKSALAPDADTPGAGPGPGPGAGPPGQSSRTNVTSMFTW